VRGMSGNQECHTTFKSQSLTRDTARSLRWLV